MQIDHYTNKIETAVRGKVAVFIDAANLEQSVRHMWVNPKDVPETMKHKTTDTLQWAVDYQKTRDFFERLGKLSDVRFYTASFPSKGHTNFLHFLDKKLQFSLRTKPLKEYGDHTREFPHRKANFDVEIAVDAVASLDSYNTFILFSGDCDFEFLLKFLRGRGKMTIVFSRSGHVAKELPPACHHYFDIVDFRDDLLQVISKKQRTPLV